MNSSDVVTSSAAPLVTIAPVDEPAVSLITVTYGTGPIVVDMIHTLAATMPATVPYELIVVDQPHPTADSCTRRHLGLDTAGVRLLRPQTNLGFGGGCEWGAQHAGADVLAFVNPDLEFLPGWFEPMRSALDEPRVSIVAPVLLESDGRIQEAGGSVTPLGWTLPSTDIGDDPVSEVLYASAACWLLRADEHERLGGFDPAFHPAYFEDVDLALRARRAGGRCVVANRSHVIHHRGGGTPDVSVSDDQHEVFVERWPLVAWRA